MTHNDKKPTSNTPEVTLTIQGGKNDPDLKQNPELKPFIAVVVERTAPNAMKVLPEGERLQFLFAKAATLEEQAVLIETKLNDIFRSTNSRYRAKFLEGVDRKSAKKNGTQRYSLAVHGIEQETAIDRIEKLTDDPRFSHLRITPPKDGKEKIYTIRGMKSEKEIGAVERRVNLFDKNVHVKEEKNHGSASSDPKYIIRVYKTPPSP